MNKSIKRIASFLCLTALLMSAVFMTAAAETELEAVVNLITYADASQDKLDITVTPDGLDTWVTVAITKSNGFPLGIIQQKVDETNNITFPMTGVPAGEELVLKISTAPSDRCKTFKRTYYSFAQQQQAMDDIMNPSIPITQEIADIISLELEGDFALLNNDGIAFLKNQLSARFADMEIIEVQTFINALNENISLSILSCKDAAIIKPYMENRKNIIGIDSITEYEWYEDLDETEKMSRVVANLATKIYTSTTAFVEAFKAENFLNTLSEKHSSDIIGFITENVPNQSINGVPVSINMVAYDALQPGQKEYFTGLIAGVRYESLDQFAAEFASKVSIASSYTEKQDTPVIIPPITPAPGGSTGGFSGGSSLGVVGGGSTGNSGNTGNIQTNTGDKEETPKPTSFKDIDSVPWAQEAITALAKDGVINGVDGENFAPNSLITREQYVKIIIGAFGLTGSETLAEFADVEEGQWYSDFIKIAVANGIINGVSENNFGIGSNISRQDMAVIIYRTAKKLGIELKKVTNDVPADIDSASEYAKEAVTALYQAGIINGVGDGKFAPADTATRAQAAKIIYGLREVK